MVEKNTVPFWKEKIKNLNPGLKLQQLFNKYQFTAEELRLLHSLMIQQKIATEEKEKKEGE